MSIRQRTSLFSLIPLPHYEGNEGGRLKYIKCSDALQHYKSLTLALPLPKVFARSEVLNKC